MVNKQKTNSACKIFLKGICNDIVSAYTQKQVSLELTLTLPQGACMLAVFTWFDVYISNTCLDRIWPFCSQKMKWYSSTNRYTHASLEALHMAMKNSKKKKVRLSTLTKMRVKDTSRVCQPCISVTKDENQCLFIWFPSCYRKYKTIHLGNMFFMK